MTATLSTATPAPAVGGTSDAPWVAPSWEQVVRSTRRASTGWPTACPATAQDAEDLTQDVFVRVFRSLSDYTPGTFEGWLHRITTNLFLDQVRRKQRIRFDALADDAADAAARAGAHARRRPTTTPTSTPTSRRALDALPPEFRAAVVLCDIEGLTYEEIAATLGIKLGTVRSRIHRGRVQLRESLAHLNPARS